MNQQTVESLLTDHGFKLARHRKHSVWKHPDGRAWTVPVTPSGQKALLNNYTDLKNFLRRGKVQGTFGLTAIDESEREAAERKLHPVKTKRARQVKERQFGIAIERCKPFKPFKPVIVQKAPRPKNKTTAPDIYTIGRILSQTFERLLGHKLETEMAEYRNEVAQLARQKYDGIVDEIMEAEPGLSKQDVTKAAENWIQNHINQDVAAESQHAKEQSQRICRAATQCFQKIVKRMPHERVSGEDVRAALGEKIEIPAADFLFAVALASFFPSSVAGITGEHSVQVETPDGRLLEPSDVWNENVKKGWDGTVELVGG